MTVHKTKDIVLYDSCGDATITVREDSDGLGMVLVKCPQDYFGKIDFSMDADTATMLAEAILEQVEYIKESIG